MSALIYKVKPVLSDHIKQDNDFSFIDGHGWPAYCCMKVAQKAPAISNHLSIAISMSPE